MWVKPPIAFSKQYSIHRVNRVRTAAAVAHPSFLPVHSFVSMRDRVVKQAYTQQVLHVAIDEIRCAATTCVNLQASLSKDDYLFCTTLFHHNVMNALMMIARKSTLLVAGGAGSTNNDRLSFLRPHDTDCDFFDTRFWVS